MKKLAQILTLIVGFTCFTNISLIAQNSTENSSSVQKTETIKALKLTVTGMTCQLGCADGLDKIFSETKGILKSKTTFKNSSSEISYDSKIISEKEIISIIKKKGYNSEVTNNIKSCDQSCTKSCCNN